MTKTQRACLIVSTWLLLLAAPACYTILQHPRVASMGYARPASDACISCHAGADLWDFHHAPRAPMYFGPYEPRWGYYYDVPWWYDALWGYEAPKTHDINPVPTRATPDTANRLRNAGGASAGAETTAPGNHTDDKKVKKGNRGGQRTNEKDE